MQEITQSYRRPETPSPEIWVLARIFFEISRRLSGYAGYGVINDPVRMAAHHALRLSAS